MKPVIHGLILEAARLQREKVFEALDTLATARNRIPTMKSACRKEPLQRREGGGPDTADQDSDEDSEYTLTRIT
jgi:hypothetical protein